MLPVHRRWRANFKKQEALWKRSISISHRVFCSSAENSSHLVPPVLDYRLHFDPQCHTLPDAGGVGGVSPAEGISFATEDGLGGDAGGLEDASTAAESKR
ncbi:ORF2 [Grizzly bear anellovirus 3]|nr:ORF2 [Grizzly bear anellovirus 3]